MTLLELWRPLHRRRPALSRSGAATDVVNFVVSEVLGVIAAIGVLAALAPLVGDVMPVMVREHLAGQAGGVRWIEAVVIAELGGYWGHRLCHEIPALWRFHRVHHSSTELDWLAAGRRHPVDATIARLSSALPMLLLGFAVPTVATVFVLKRLRGLVVHANVNLRCRPLERLYVTPFFHHWHHSNQPGTWNTNYAVSFPVVDWMFGTLHLPDRWPSAYGCDGHVPHRQYLAQLLSPWRHATPSPRVSTATDHHCHRGENKQSQAAGSPTPESVQIPRPPATESDPTSFLALRAPSEPAC
jgi:sterol desaturase/sphingolipid hydroxylase (fatty acid hydroxylase superfamily)